MNKRHNGREKTVFEKLFFCRITFYTKLYKTPLFPPVPSLIHYFGFLPSRSFSYSLFEVIFVYYIYFIYYIFPPFPAWESEGAWIVNWVGGVVLFISILASSSLPQHLERILLWFITVITVPIIEITILAIDKTWVSIIIIYIKISTSYIWNPKNWKK